MSAEYGLRFSRRNLHYMVRFAEVFAEEEMVPAVPAQLTWTASVIRPARGRPHDLAPFFGGKTDSSPPAAADRHRRFAARRRGEDGRWSL
ncbi:MAG: DUF1016 domain-containing protein [Oligoflexia bacterium]|nr:DUF1016 domain-containing protein [Oligoflexia bacterium]